MGNNSEKLPLQGIKVIELATVVAAPTVGRMLCSYGEDMIKVESAKGDDMRCAGNFERVVCEDGKNPLFTIQNSGKKFILLDIKTEEGKSVLFKLLESADVLITNIRSAALRRSGLDYDALKQRFPRMIYAHLSGFGPKGPDAANPGFDSTGFWLRSGPLADWQVPGSFPFVPTYAFGDMATSSVLLSGILMALLGRAQTGHGTKVETSLYASGIWCNAIGVVSHQEQFGGQFDVDPMRPADPFSQVYKCADRKYIGIYDNEYRRDLPKLAKIFGIEELAGDPRCESLEKLSETGAIVEMVTALNRVFLTRTGGEWRSLLIENSVSCEIMRRAREVSADPQAIANGYVAKVEFKDGLEVMMPCPPIHFSEYRTKEYKSAGALGSDTDSVLASLGYSGGEIEKMRENNNIK